MVIMELRVKRLNEERLSRAVIGDVTSIEGKRKSPYITVSLHELIMYVVADECQFLTRY